MMMIRVMITAVIVQVPLPVFSYFLFYITFLLLPISLPTCSILCYVYFPIYFASSFPLPYVMVPSWLYVSSGAQPHDFFSYCLGQILQSVAPVSLRCDANEIKLHQHRIVQPWKKQSPYLYNALIQFLFRNVFLSRYLYLQFPFLFLCTSFYKPGFFTFGSHHHDLSDLDSCAETGDFEILL